MAALMEGCYYLENAYKLIKNDCRPQCVEKRSRKRCSIQKACTKGHQEAPVGQFKDES